MGMEVYYMMTMIFILGWDLQHSQTELMYENSISSIYQETKEPTLGGMYDLIQIDLLEQHVLGQRL